MIGAIVDGALGAVGGLFGGLSSNSKVREQLRMLADRQRENQDWFDRRYNEDATQRADAQRLLTRTEEAIKARNRAAAGTAAVMGGTNERVAAAKAAGNQAMADTASQIAAQGERRKDAIEQQYLRQKNALAEQEAALTGKKKSTLDIMNDTIGGGAAGVASALG